MKKVKKIIEKINKISKIGKKIQMKKMIENNQLMKAVVKLLNNLKESNKRKQQKHQNHLKIAK